RISGRALKEEQKKRRLFWLWLLLGIGVGIGVVTLLLILLWPKDPKDEADTTTTFSVTSKAEPGQKNHFRTIAEALEHANPGYHIVILDDVHVERLVFKVPLGQPGLKKPVTI